MTDEIRENSPRMTRVRSGRISGKCFYPNFEPPVYQVSCRLDDSNESLVFVVTREEYDRYRLQQEMEVVEDAYLCESGEYKGEERLIPHERR